VARRGKRWDIAFSALAVAVTAGLVVYAVWPKTGRLAIEFARAKDREARVVSLGLTHCFQDAPFRLQETASEVRVTIDVVFREGAELPACLASVSANLDAPIGERRIVDVKSRRKHKVIFDGETG
jgi:hypothetical protein